MPLVDIPFKPGIYTDDTPRDAGKLAYWKDGDKVRFYNGLPQKLGGWQKASSDPVLGVVRKTVDWGNIDASTIYRALASHNHLTVWNDYTFYDITPIESTGTLTNPFSVTEGSATMTVAHTAHGRIDGSRVIFSGATEVGLVNPNGEYGITVIDDNTYTVELPTAAFSTQASAGGTVTYQYEIQPGLVSTTAVDGYGTSTYGVDTWGTPRTVTEFATRLRLWSLDHWGEDLLACPRGGKLYVWDSSAGTGQRAVPIDTAPATNLYTFVSYEDRHVISLGAHDGTSDNPMLVRWCDQENYTDWTPSLTNTAGAKQLDQGSELLTAARARGEHLLFTDTYIFSMTFVGPPYTFAFRPVATNGGLVGPNAVHSKDGIVYWMGDGGFYLYDGSVRPIPCSVSRHVFDRLDKLQAFKVCCGVVREYDEVWWFYPVAGENDEYVIFNTRDNSWSIGTLDRTVLVGDAITGQPYAVDAQGYMYNHEVLHDDESEAMGARIVSGDFEIGSGTDMAQVSKIIPDFDVLEGEVGIEITAKRYPGSSEFQTSGVLPVTATTEKRSTRVRGRQVSVSVVDNGVGTDWRLGLIRVEIRPHGKR